MKVSSKRLRLMLVVAAIFVSATAVNAAEKQRVCHLDDKDGSVGKVFEVSEKAVNAHLKHGDPAIFIVKKDGSCEKYVERRRR
ncbi:MAG: hypothetical protein RQ824_03965 [bacterium]|nr:hypothetical protein [bacterium]